MRARAAIVAASCLGCLAFAAPAGASVVGVTTVSGVTVDAFIAADGEQNALSITYGAGYVDFRDDNHNPMSVDPGSTADCASQASDEVACNQKDYVLADLGDGNDSAYGGNQGEGGSTFTGPEEIDGGPGNDQIAGRDGNDYLDGGPGNDDLEFPGSITNGTVGSAAGNDDIHGGDGNDTVWYIDNTEDINITLDDQPGDGPAGQNDNIHSDVENVRSGSGNDVITGNDSPNYLDGGAGNDVIHGGGGDDQVYGGSGNDQVYGDAGNDTVNGGPHDDLVDGGPGMDSLFGDSNDSPDGNDHLQARDGQVDSVACGFGADTVVADPQDVISTDPLQFCESVDRQLLGGAGGSQSGTSGPQVTSARAVPARFCTHRSSTCRHPGTTLKFTLSEDATVTVTAKLVKKARVFRFKGKRGPNKVHFSGKGLKPGRYKLRLTAIDAAGNKSTVATIKVKVVR